MVVLVLLLISSTYYIESCRMVWLVRESFQLGVQIKYGSKISNVRLTAPSMQPSHSQKLHIGWITLWRYACLLPRSFDTRRVKVSETELVHAKVNSLTQQAAQTILRSKSSAQACTTKPDLFSTQTSSSLTTAASARRTAPRCCCPN